MSRLISTEMGQVCAVFATANIWELLEVAAVSASRQARTCECRQLTETVGFRPPERPDVAGRRPSEWRSPYPWMVALPPAGRPHSALTGDAGGSCYCKRRCRYLNRAELERLGLAVRDDYQIPLETEGTDPDPIDAILSALNEASKRCRGPEGSGWP